MNPARTTITLYRYGALGTDGCYIRNHPDLDIKWFGPLPACLGDIVAILDIADEDSTHDSRTVTVAGIGYKTVTPYGSTYVITHDAERRWDAFIKACNTRILQESINESI